MRGLALIACWPIAPVHVSSKVSAKGELFVEWRDGAPLVLRFSGVAIGVRTAKTHSGHVAERPILCVVPA